MAKDTDNALVMLDNAKKLLAQCTSIPEAKKVMDIGKPLEVYARRAKLSTEAVQQALEVKVTAMKLLGDMLKQIEKAQGTKGAGRPKKLGGNARVLPKNGSSLKELGISKRESAEAQHIADLKKNDFAKLRAGILSIRQAIRLVKINKLQRKERQAVKKNGFGEFILTSSQKVIPCEVIICDPPYGILKNDWDPPQKNIEAFTRKWAKKWNNAGADFILTFFTQKYLWEAKEWFDQSFKDYDFQQLLIWHYQTNKKVQSRMGFKVSYDPIFFYRRKGCERKIGDNDTFWGGGENGLHVYDCYCSPIPQTNFNGVNRKVHPAQKPIEVLKWLVNATTKIGDLVCDPFMGSGTGEVACKQLHRKFYSIETNKKYLELAKQRVAMYGINGFKQELPSKVPEPLILSAK